MNIKRYLYLEQDSERKVTAKSFVSRQDAEKYASHRLHETIYDVLGPNYQIPPEHIDEEGNIAHSMSGVEIDSSKFGWSIWWNDIESARADIEEEIIEITPTEMKNLCFILNQENQQHTNVRTDSRSNNAQF